MSEHSTEVQLALLIQWRAQVERDLQEAHEQVHAVQQRIDGVLKFWWRYLTNKAHRQAYEVEAYKVQIANGASVFSCAVQLSNGYGLNLTQAEAMKLLEA